MEEQEMNTKITARFILFDREKTGFEIDSFETMELTVEQAKERILKKLHEATGEDGKPLKYDEDYDDGTPKPKERFEIFNTIQFLEILIEYRKKMIKYSWRRATLKNSRTRMIENSQYGSYVMTKTIM